MFKTRIATAGLSFFILATSMAQLVGCAPNISIASTRNASVTETIEPAAFVIYEGNTGKDYTEPLQSYLKQELAKRQIPGRVEIISGAEFDEGHTLKKFANGMRGMVTIQPVGGTSYYGSLSQILYEVAAYRITDPEKGEVTKVWRARVDTSSGAYGFQIDSRLAHLAEDLVGRLVDERVVATASKPSSN
jgi:hypothetical protein